jgi:hypothetical protein
VEAEMSTMSSRYADTVSRMYEGSARARPFSPNENRALYAENRMPTAAERAEGEARHARLSEEAQS